MKSACLKCARHQQLEGFKVCKESFSILWGILINNLAADLGLTDDQTTGLVKIADEMDKVLTGAKETGLEPAEYAEYLNAKADECTAKLRAMCVAEKGLNNGIE